MQNANTFNHFINEASLEGNLGIPGEEGSGRPSWLGKAKRQNAQDVSSFSRERQADIREFGGLIEKSKRLQRGHERELSELTVAAFRELYGSFLDGITLDLKIDDGRGIKAMLDETPESSEIPDIEEIEDDEVRNQIHKRKILRSIQQGKGVNSKAILNLSIFKDGLSDIMGEEKGASYLEVLNKISRVAQWLYLSQPDAALKNMIKFGNAAGASSIEIEKEEESDTDVAEKVLSDIENGEEINDNENVEDLLNGLNVTIKAKGQDLSILIHETIKGIYMMLIQASIETLNGEVGGQIVLNTETMFDEIEEIKYGPQMQAAFFKVIAEHPKVIERIDRMLRDNASDVEIASFQETLNYLFFNIIAQIGVDNAKEMLDLVNEIFMESSSAEELCDPLITQALSQMEEEQEYQMSRRTSTPSPRMEQPTLEPETGRTNMSSDEITDAILDAYAKGDMDEVARLRKLLGEGYRFPRLSASLLFEKRKR